MPQSAEFTLKEIESLFREMAFLPAIAGGAPMSAEFTLERIKELIESGAIGGGSGATLTNPAPGQAVIVKPTAVGQVTRLVQTGSPTDGDFRLRVQGTRLDGVVIDTNAVTIQWDDPEEQIQFQIDDTSQLVGGVLVSGDADDFTLTFIGLMAGAVFTVTVTQNDMDGGGDYTISNPVAASVSYSLVNGELSANQGFRALLAMLLRRGGWPDGTSEGIIDGLSFSVEGPEILELEPGFALIRGGSNLVGQQSFLYYKPGSADENIYSLFDPPASDSRIDLVVAQADPVSGVVAPAVVAGTPVASVAQVTRLVQTGAPTSGTFRIRRTFTYWYGDEVVDDSNEIAFDALEATIEGAMSDPPVVSGDADDFLLTFSFSNHVGKSVTVEIVNNTMDGGGDYDITTETPASGPSAPSLPDYAIELSRVYIPADETDAAEWIFNATGRVTGSFVPRLGELMDVDASGVPGASLVRKLDEDNNPVDFTFADNRRWKPAHFIDSWNVNSTYSFGEAVRSLDGATWELYISQSPENTGHNPLTDTDAWQNVVSDGQPVILQGTANPNTFGEQNRITHYTQDATGGTFDLGDAAGIAWGAAGAAIQAALDLAYDAGRMVVTGDAADFSVKYLFSDESSLDFDDSNLTGGGLTLQEDTQDQVFGGFYAPDGSLFIQTNTADGSSLWRNFKGVSVEPQWRLVNGIGVHSSSYNTDISAVSRIIITDESRGDISSTVGMAVSSESPVVATVRAFLEAQSVVGESDSSISAGGNGSLIEIGANHDSTGSYVRFGNAALFANDGKGHKLGDLAVDPALATPEQIYNAFVQAGLFVDGS